MNTKQSVENKIVEVASGTWGTSVQKFIAGIERAKRNLVAQFRDKKELPQILLGVALSEAEAQAWETEYPQLVFPTLAEEKIAAISDWYGHGKQWERSYALAV